MRRQITSAVCFFVLCVGMAAGQESGAAVVPSREDVLRFMNLMQVQARMKQMIEGMQKSAHAGAEAGFKQSLPNATPEQLARVDELVDASFKDFPIDEIIDAVVPIYQKHLSKSDLDAIMTFYTSPVGRKLLNEQPAMMAEGMQAGQQVMLKRLPEITNRLKTEVAKMIDEEKNKQEPPKKQTN